MPKLNTHQIRVETEADEVNVTIADHGGVAGGFAKFFNRVIDSGVWADLSDAARAAYMPLVRFADHRNHFRIRIGQASLMKHSGLSRSSVKRAMKDLIGRRLVVVVGQGGVTPDGQNESNLYQLLVPGPATPARPAATAADAVTGPDSDPLPDRMRTPGRPRTEPGGGSAADPDRGRRWALPPSIEPAPPGSAVGPQFRSKVQEINNNSRLAPRVGGTACSPAPPSAAALLLMEHGVDPQTSRSLAERYPQERIVDVIATMEYRRARGKCDNPGGFLRDALVKQWQVPRAVTEEREQAAKQARRQEAEMRMREAEAAGDARAREQEWRVERCLDALDEEEFMLLAAEVLRKYQGNPAVLTVLTRRPPRECRLMKMEIAALLDSSSPAPRPDAARGAVGPPPPEPAAPLPGRVYDDRVKLNHAAAERKGRADENEAQSHE